MHPSNQSINRMTHRSHSANAAPSSPHSPICPCRKIRCPGSGNGALVRFSGRPPTGATTFPPCPHGPDRPSWKTPHCAARCALVALIGCLIVKKKRDAQNYIEGHFFSRRKPTRIPRGNSPSFVGRTPLTTGSVCFNDTLLISPLSTSLTTCDDFESFSMVKILQRNIFQANSDKKKIPVRKSTSNGTYVLKIRCGTRIMMMVDLLVLGLVKKEEGKATLRKWIIREGVVKILFSGLTGLKLKRVGKKMLLFVVGWILLAASAPEEEILMLSNWQFTHSTAFIYFLWKSLGGGSALYDDGAGKSVTSLPRGLAWIWLTNVFGVFACFFIIGTCMRIIILQHWMNCFPLVFENVKAKNRAILKAVTKKENHRGPLNEAAPSTVKLKWFATGGALRL